MVLVGNKSDLTAQRQVPKEEGMNLAAEWNCAWTEASARHNENVVRSFELCIEQIEIGNSPLGEEKRACIIL
jgi:Ras homolog enriched in brain